MQVGIIGSGIIGLSIADELLRQNDAVTLFDPGPPGAEASSAAAGMLAPQLEATAPGPLLQLCLRSRALYAGWQARLAQASGLSLDYRRSGALKLAFTPAELSALESEVAWQQTQDLRANMLSRTETLAREPALNPALLGAAHFPDEAQVDNQRLVQALAMVVKKMGGRWVHEGVIQLNETSGQITGLRTPSGLHRFDAVVLCAGAWSGLVSGPTGLNEKSVFPARGQLAALSCAQVSLSHLIVGAQGYLVTRPNHVIAGTTMERAGYEKAVTAEGLTRVLAAATTLCPALQTGKIVETWSGLRPAAADPAPILGRGPLPGLFLATAHFRNGILLAPLTAQLLGECLREHACSFDLEPFRHDRFSP
ncbi:MAG: glycine oxidase ThiO [Myxococcaceae bacterium]|nr:glycine oxidase ThiO [Myxococcaceae bacterium]